MYIETLSRTLGMFSSGVQRKGTCRPSISHICNMSAGQFQLRLSCRSKKHLEKVALLREVLADDEDLDPDLQSELLADNMVGHQQPPVDPEGNTPKRGQSSSPDMHGRLGNDPGERAELLSSCGPPSGRASQEAAVVQESEEEADGASEAELNGNGDDDSSDMLAALAQMQQQKGRQQEATAAGEGRSESEASIANLQEDEANQPSRQSSANFADPTDLLASNLEGLPLESSIQGKRLTRESALSSLAAASGSNIHHSKYSC